MKTGTTATPLATTHFGSSMQSEFVCGLANNEMKIMSTSSSFGIVGNEDGGKTVIFEIAGSKTRNGSSFCCENSRLADVFSKVPFQSYVNHSDMYLKTMRAFMFKHEYLDYATVYVYKTDSKFTKIDIGNVLSNVPECKGRILVMGIKKHLADM